MSKNGTIIIKNCNQATLDIPLKYAQKLYNDFAIHHPNAFYLKTRVRGMRDWDGKIKYINKRGDFKIGLLPAVLAKCKEYGIKPKVVDLRNPVPKVTSVVKEVGRFTLRPEQVKAVESICFNQVNNNPFHIGVLDYTVNAGKCTGKGTLIRTSRGLLPIEKIVDEYGNILSDCKVLTQEGEYIKPSAGVFNKIKAIRITTSQGYELICGYDNHRLFTLNETGELGWVYAHNLKPGDNIPLYMGKMGKQSNNISPELAYAMGCIHGDGHVLKTDTGRLVISISGQDYEVAEAYVKALDKVCKTPLKIKPNKRFKGFHISKSDTQLTQLITSTFPELIGLSYDKVIPQSILEASPEVQVNYIAGLYDTDGSNSISRRTISFSSVCKENTKRLQNLLLSLGIPSCRRIKKTLCKGKKGMTYRLTVHSEYYDRFLELIPLRIPRKRVVHSLKRNNYQPKLPLEIGKVISDEYRNQDWKTRGSFKARFGRTLTQQVLKPERATLQALKVISDEAFGEISKCKSLYNFCSQVYWDTIENIEVLEEYPCYDMDIPKYHNYISNGFISHNTLIMAATYLSFKRGLKTLLITNDSDWLNQAKEEFKEYLPGEPINFIQGRSKKPWTQFNIGMVQSLSRNMKFYQREMAQVDMVFVDEADQAGSKQYQNVLTHLYNTRVRIGLSGTIYMSKLAKDKVKNMNLRAFFGDVIERFTLKESIKKGYSTNVVVKMIEVTKWMKSMNPNATLGNNYREVYDNCITQNQQALVPIISRVDYNIKYGRLPILIVCKFIKHAEIIYAELNKVLGNTYNIACVHVNTPAKQRINIMQDFRSGKIQILVSTTIIARGKNFPLLRAMINAGSMKAQEKTIQFLGRLVRTHSSKSKAYLDDIHYPGKYLDNHGKSRRRYYQEQGLKVIRIPYKSK